MSERGRQRGMLLGLAIGDALGAAIEFRPPGSFVPVTDYRGGGPYGLAPGEWTDDTSMALAMADSIIERGWDLNHQAERYLAWYRAGEYSVTGKLFDIGIQTSFALRRFEESGDARTSGDPGERSSGNGSIMRLAPVPMAFGRKFPDRLEELVIRAVESSLPTHPSPQCRSACACMAVIMAALAAGFPRERVLDPNWPVWYDVEQFEPIHPLIQEVISGSYLRKKPPEIRGSGHVVKSLEAALWAFAGAGEFREAVLRAVNLGDDADTTGAVCGQLAGAAWGESGIPSEWLEGLARRDLIDRALDGLGR